MNNRPTRKNSLRYPQHDYASAGAVFITLCVSSRLPLFGVIEDGLVNLNAAGTAITKRWKQIPSKFSTVDIDAMVVMPDHMHGIVFTGVNPDTNEPSTSIGEVVRWLKVVTQIDYRSGVKTLGWQPYAGTLWQSRFNDHIIRNDRDFEVHRRYIEGNPGRRWEKMISQQPRKRLEP